MRKIAGWSLLSLCAALGSASVNAAATCANPVGAWVNQLNSTLTITSVDSTNGQISGTYVSPQGTNGQAFTVIGWVNQSSTASNQDSAVIISFTVNWGAYGTVTSWTGVCRLKANTLVALWHLGSAQAKFEWSHVLSGEDIFSPMPDASPSAARKTP